MELKDLAPWIAISITLAISILVPLFTQIANNKHQRKLQKEKFEYEQKQKKLMAYENFLTTVGAAVTYETKDNVPLAGASIKQIYVYAPIEWWDDLDVLSDYLRKQKWSDAAEVSKKISRLIANEIKDC